METRDGGKLNAFNYRIIKVSLPSAIVTVLKRD